MPCMGGWLSQHALHGGGYPSMPCMGGCLLGGGLCGLLLWPSGVVAFCYGLLVERGLDPPPQQMATVANGTHPTGMHSCIYLIVCSWACIFY